jgi:hypothetical protein
MNEKVEEKLMVKKAFESVFGSREGKLVLRHLFANCHQNIINFTGDVHILAYEAGKYAMFCDILTMSEMPLDEYMKQFIRNEFGDKLWKKRR